MASDAIQPDEFETSDAIEVGAPELAWSQAWQLPVLLLGLGLLVIGVYFALPRYAEPDYPGVLADIEAHLKANELEQAEQKLDALSADERFEQAVNDATKGHVHQLYGDLRFRQIDKRVWRGITTPTGKENLQQIAGHYRRADRLGREMPTPALRRYAETLAALGDDDGALNVIARIPRGDDPPRHELIRDLIEKRVQTESDPGSEKLSRLIVEFEKELDTERDRVVRRDQQIWVMSIKAERLLRAGDPNGVIRLLVEGGLLALMKDGATPRDLAPLTVRLGEAYARLNQYEQARIQLREAQANLPDGDPLNPRILVAFGDITLAEGMAGQYNQAYNFYRQAYDADKMGPSSIAAIIGLGHTEANRDGRFPEALQWFALAVERMKTEEVPAWDPRYERLAHYMRDVHVQRSFERGQYAEALQLLKAYAPLEAPDLGAETLGWFAQVYQKLGEQALSQAEALKPDPNNPGEDPNIKARRIHNQDAAQAFEQAGDYFRRQAGELTHTTEAHGEALWSAAENYEKAQLWREAVAVYTDFLDTSDRGDKREQASFRVAQALLAEGQAAAAVQRFREIIDTAPSGEWAKPSYVPMARGLSEIGKWGEAERLLRSVLENHPSIGPDSAFYHDALIALGQLYYSRGTDEPSFYARAIEVLGEEGGAVERIQLYVHNVESDQADSAYLRDLLRKLPQLRYMLADSLRLSARGLLTEAEQARTETERLAKLSERTKRLSDAQMYYNQVIYDMKDWHPDSFSQLEWLYFRNAHFYQADCVFDRGDYETAIGLYLNAVSKWQDHPAALVGWVQIMNARAELGQIEAARSAHARAIELFNQMPEGAFERPDALMTRQRWDDWLQWMQQLDLFGPGTATAGVPTPGG
ncbi:MAG: hypothetical protein ACE37H_04660 [Phycisphaeraceae bacterium]